MTTKTTPRTTPGEPEAASRSDTPTIDPTLIEKGRVVIVGLGGIGSFLARLLTLFLAHLSDLRIRVVLVDGDTYEERNRERMEVPALANKAAVLCEQLSGTFGRPRLFIRPVEAYVGKDNVEEILAENDIVFSCVDNHATRKLLSDRCQELENVTLISGGNDGVEDGLAGTAGNVQVFIRRNGVNDNAPLTQFHPEIRDPQDEVPGPSCADLAATTAPQIVFTNFFAAAVMGCAFYRLLRSGPGGDTPIYDEACFDIHDAKLLSHFFH